MIYPFKNKGKMYYLRLTPIEETFDNYFIGEIDLLNQLAEKHFPSVRIYKAKENRDFQKIETPFGSFYMVAFEGVVGD